MLGLMLTNKNTVYEIFHL